MSTLMDRLKAEIAEWRESADHADHCKVEGVGAQVARVCSDKIERILQSEPQEPSATPSTLDLCGPDIEARYPHNLLQHAVNAASQYTPEFRLLAAEILRLRAALRSSEGPETGRPPLDLAPIKAREAAAKKGPWRADCPRIVWRIRTLDGSYVLEGNQYQCYNDGANAVFIAEARQDIPALIAEVERLAALAAGPETGDRERLRELAFIGAVAVHREVWRYSHNAMNIDGHTDRDFNACPHPDCVLVRQAAPAASEGQKS